jgi:hypothetical protein
LYLLGDRSGGHGHRAPLLDAPLQCQELLLHRHGLSFSNLSKTITGRELKQTEWDREEVVGEEEEGKQTEWRRRRRKKNQRPVLQQILLQWHGMRAVCVHVCKGRSMSAKGVPCPWRSVVRDGEIGVSREVPV